MEKPLQNRLKRLDFRSAESKHLFWFKSSKDRFIDIICHEILDSTPNITIKLLTHPHHPTTVSLYGYCVRTDIYTHVYAFQTISWRYSFLFVFYSRKKTYTKSKKRNTRRRKVVQLNDFQFLFIYFCYTFFFSSEWGTNGLEGDVEIINFHIHEQEGKQMQ